MSHKQMAWVAGTLVISSIAAGLLALAFLYYNKKHTIKVKWYR